MKTSRQATWLATTSDRSSADRLENRQTANAEMQTPTDTLSDDKGRL